MAWTIEYTNRATNQLDHLDRQISDRIIAYMDERIATLDDPRHMGRGLTGNRGGYWRYRVGNYRVICDIQDEVLRVLVLEVGHRGQVYR